MLSVLPSPVGTHPQWQRVLWGGSCGNTDSSRLAPMLALAGLRENQVVRLCGWQQLREHLQHGHSPCASVVASRQTVDLLPFTSGLRFERAFRLHPFAGFTRVDVRVQRQRERAEIEHRAPGSHILMAHFHPVAVPIRRCWILRKSAARSSSQLRRGMAIDEFEQSSLALETKSQMR